MKRTTIIYWIFTGLFAAFMLFSAIPDAMSTQEALDFMGKLGYPAYIVPFLGVAKILGVIAILIPGYPRIKEWAYAGLVYDLIGATYSVAFGMPITAATSFMLVPLFLAAGSYIYYHKRMKEARLSDV